MSLNNQVLDKLISENLPYVEANLVYLIPMTEKPVTYNYEPPGIPRTNASYENHKVRVYNARSISKNISLDKQGFAFTEHYTNVHDFYDEDEIRQVYYPEVEQLLKQVTGATEVLIFDHTLRNAQLMNPARGIREPAKRAHNFTR